MKDLMELEDEKYSELYKNGYPHSSPEYVIRRNGYDKNQYVCDLGCGMAEAAKYFNKYVGVDVSKYAIEQNIINFNNDKNKKFYHSPLNNLGFLKNEHFNLVLVLDVMEHLYPDDIDDALNEISKLNADIFAFHISLVPSVRYDKNGNNLHLSLYNENVWIEKLKKYFKPAVSRSIRLEYHISVEIKPIKR